MNKLDQILQDIRNEEPAPEQMDEAAGRVRRNLFAPAATGADRIRNCADYQSLIPAYLNHTLSAGRSLLLQDHTRECVACRRELGEARSGMRPTLVRPMTPPSRTIPKAWAIAAMALVTVGLAGWMASSLFLGGGAGTMTVQAVSGTLYEVAGATSTPVFPGREINRGQRVRTGKGSTAVVRWGDGSLVEMNSRAELSVSRELTGSTIHLTRGEIIVQAAKQKLGTLNVLTKDCNVSVKGTIFTVAMGMRGSAVGVVEGAVKVEQGSQSRMLKPGERYTSDAGAAGSLQESVAWSRDSARYLALLNEFQTIRKQLEALPGPALRYESKLLGYVPEDTILFASMPNLSGTLADAQKLFNERLQQSEVLRTWWSEQKDGPQLQEMVDKLRTFSDYLGDEIVLAVGGDWDGNYSRPIVLAEVKRPGLDAYLKSEFQALAARGAHGLPEVLALTGADSGRFDGRYRRPSLNAGGDGPMLFGVKDGLLAVAWDREQMEMVAARAAEKATPGDHGLMHDVQASYKDGAGWLLCVNMEHIARNSVGGRSRQMRESKMPAGLEAMRYLTVERKEIGGRTENMASLTFAGRRSGLAAWLASPSTMGSLDFVSPEASAAVAVAMENPAAILRDVFNMLKASNPNFEQGLEKFRSKTGMPLSPSLADPLGGEFSFALDGPMVPLPAWKLIVEVNDPARLQWTIEQFVTIFNDQAQCTDCKLHLTKEDVAGRTYYTLKSEKFTYELDYVYVDGYLLAAPERTLIDKAIQNRATGYVLSRSEGFRALLPKDGRLNFSAFVYQNLSTSLGPLLSQFMPQNQAVKQTVANAGPSLIYAYGADDRITIGSGGSFFGLDLNSLALPALLGNKGAPVKGKTTVQ
jgi:hypothetical protein